MNFKKGYSVLVIGSIVLLSACQLRGPRLTPAMQQVHSVSDTENCEFIESSYLESRPQLIHQYVKRNVHRAGGDSYKILDVSRDSAAGMEISMVTYEAYKCRD